MPQFLYRIQAVRPEMLSEGTNETEYRIIEEHFAYLKELMEKRTLILARGH